MDSSLRSVRLFLIVSINIAIAYVETIISFFTKPKKKNISGQNVLITGAGHGLGREMAFKFAEQGANVVLVDINQANNEQVKSELATTFTKSKFLSYSVDIRDEKKVASLAADVRRDLGADIDILVNNAGIVQCKPFSELTSELVERTFQVNVLAHIWTVKYFLPAMIKNQSGHIVAISSIAGLIGGKYLTDYCASKFAVVGLMESIEREIHDTKGANENIHLTTICPCCMSTGMFQTFRTRFDWLLPVLDARDVAKEVIEAVLTNKLFVTVPAVSLLLHRLSYLMPKKVQFLAEEYLDYGVKPHAN